MSEELTEDEGSGEGGYEFDDSFQRKIAALTLRDTAFTQATEGLIRPEFFERDADAALVKIALDFFNTYKKAPDLASIPTLIKAAFADKRIRKDLKEDVLGRLKELLGADLSDGKFVADKVSEFAKHRAIEQAILDSVSALERKDYAKIEKLIRSAMDIGTTDDGGEYDYWTEIENRTTERIDEAAGAIKPDGISTGIPDLDDYLYHKGWGRKELAVMMGAAKAGKSMSLGEFAKNASLAGYNVLYATLEVSAKIMSNRIDANLSDTAIRVLKDHPHAVKAKIEAVSKKAGKFQIHEFPSGTLKVSGLRRLLERYRSRGVIFDMIVVDYADIMAAERFSGDLREDMRQIYIDLRAIAFHYNCAMLTATQTNREGAKSAVAKMTDVAEDFNKIRTADIVISINATEEEVKAGEARLYFAASRNSEAGVQLLVKQDRSKMKFLTKILARL